ELEGLIFEENGNGVWLGDPVTQMVDEDTASDEPDWFITFPVPNLGLGHDVTYQLAVFATDGSDVMITSFTTAKVGAPPSREKPTKGAPSPPAREMAASAGIVQWDQIKFNTGYPSVDNKRTITVKGQTPNWEKARVHVLLIGPPVAAGSRRYFKRKR